MTRLNLGFATFTAILLTFNPIAIAHAQDVCAQSGDREQVECLAQKIEAANQALQSVYAAALAKMPEADPTDKRRNKSQLEQAQTAWNTYMEANCAYVGGAEGGSNQWVTNFASRCKLKAIQDRTVFLRSESGAQNSSAVARPISDTPMSPQSVLDFLAKPMPHNANNPAPPPSFAAWNADQRNLIPRQTIGHCTAVWGMMNPVKPYPLLPPAQNQADAGKLALEVCVTANLPRDWPTRASALADIQRILHRSTELGQPLSLPESLAG